MHEVDRFIRAHIPYFALGVITLYGLVMGAIAWFVDIRKKKVK
jgi:hypothetical protein